jgi:hypothetical protein
MGSSLSAVCANIIRSHHFLPGKFSRAKIQLTPNFLDSASTRHADPNLPFAYPVHRNGLLRGLRVAQLAGNELGGGDPWKFAAHPPRLER